MHFRLLSGLGLYSCQSLYLEQYQKRKSSLAASRCTEPAGESYGALNGLMILK